jgi:hypothetical protein
MQRQPLTNNIQLVINPNHHQDDQRLEPNNHEDSLKDSWNRLKRIRTNGCVALRYQWPVDSCPDDGVEKLSFFVWWSGILE